MKETGAVTRQRLVAMEQSRRGVQAKQCAVGNGGRGGFWLAQLLEVCGAGQGDRGVGPTPCREARGAAQRRQRNGRRDQQPESSKTQATGRGKGNWGTT